MPSFAYTYQFVALLFSQISKATVGWPDLQVYQALLELPEAVLYRLVLSRDSQLIRLEFFA